MSKEVEHKAHRNVDEFLLECYRKGLHPSDVAHYYKQYYLKDHPSARKLSYKQLTQRYSQLLDKLRDARNADLDKFIELELRKLAKMEEELWMLWELHGEMFESLDPENENYPSAYRRAVATKTRGLKALDLLLRIIDQRAKMLGIYTQNLNITSSDNSKLTFSLDFPTQNSDPQ